VLKFLNARRCHNFDRESLPPDGKDVIIGVLAVIALILSTSNTVAASERFNLSYGPKIEQVMDICVPSAQTPAAAVIMIHGGGWSGGRKEDFRPFCHAFAANGIAAATIGYRLADGTSGGAWPAQIEDLALAANWLTDHAVEFNIDPQKICLFGHSSGAQIALMLPVNPDVARARATFRPACIVDNWGPVDFSYPPPIHSALQKLFPGGMGRVDENSVSPLNLIGSNYPPVFVAQGLEDTLVPPSQSQALINVLRTHNVKYEYVEFQGGHEMLGSLESERKALFTLEVAFILRMTATNVSSVKSSSPQRLH
jgi:acetyl esterase/lipase